MPTNIVAVITDIGRQRLMEGWGQTTTLTDITSFKVGEGGWESTPGGNVPRDPTDPGAGNNRGPVLTDLDCIENPSDYPVTSRGTYSKALTGTDFAYSGNTTLEVTCFLDSLEPPATTLDLYEIGLFNSASEMVAYGTFPLVDKSPGVSRTFTVKINANRS